MSNTKPHPARIEAIRFYQSKEKIMPHVIVKLWRGKSESQKTRLAAAIVTDVTQVLGYGKESVSAAFEEISARDWADKVYAPDILGNAAKLYKKPGNARASLP
jgi:4-oxalocrotonate tautomerase